MNITIAIATIGLAVLPQDDQKPRSEVSPLAPQEASSPVKPDRATRLRELSARAAVAEKDLLFSTVPEERARGFVDKERGRFRNEVATKREQLDFLKSELKELSDEYRVQARSGRKKDADEFLARNRKEIVKKIKEYSALSREITHGERQIDQMGVADKRLAALIDYKNSERRKYERSHNGNGIGDPTGIDPNLIPEVMTVEEDEQLSPDAQRLFEALFGMSAWDVEAFTVEVAQAIRWRY